MEGIKTYMFVKKLYNLITVIAICIAAAVLFVFAKNKYSNADFGKTFGSKATKASSRLAAMEQNFTLCSNLCKENNTFIKSIVFPEVMRFDVLKDDIETESLRTLYVQLGEEYANFSIGFFQMKPSFAVQVETKAQQLLPGSICNELQLYYTDSTEEAIRAARVDRLQDTDWQLVYLTAFICICNKIYSHKIFNSDTERLQWYATVYNAGFDKTDTYIRKKIEQDNFYLAQQMPGKKFKYAAIATWYYATQNH
jgi:hypothetical protein